MCLSIPYNVDALGSSTVTLKLNNRPLQGTLNHLHPNNTIIVGVEYTQSSNIKVAVTFQPPIEQCAKTMPISTGVSGGSIDYNWMVSSSLFLPVSGSLIFASTMETAAPGN